MKVEMLTISCGPKGNHHPGQIIDVPEAEAKDLIKGGHAKAVPEPAKKAAGKAKDKDGGDA